MPASLARQLRELVGVYLMRQRQHAHEEGLPPQSHHLLAHLKRLGPVTQGEFGRAVALDKSWVSRIVDRFVEEGLVERVALEQDRRCQQLRLTAAGVEQAALIDRQLTAYAAQLLAPIPAAEHAALGHALTLLIAALREPVVQEA